MYLRKNITPANNAIVLTEALLLWFGPPANVLSKRSKTYFLFDVYQHVFDDR